jgi:cytochrome c-type biogenesis protein CcmH
MRICFLALALHVLYSPMAVASDDIVAELASAALPDPPLEDPPSATVAAARTKRLQVGLRCPVCQGLSVSDSPSTAARAMGDRIEELVKSGYTEEQITEYFVDRYGAWVELEPPAEQHPALTYAPLAVMGLGAFLVFSLGRRRQTEASPQDETALPNADDALAPWRAKILAELGDE